MKELIKVSNQVKGVNLIVLPTGVRNVASVKISFPAGKRFSVNNIIPDFVAQMLELGVEGMSKEVIAKTLESGAINWNINCGATWVDVSVAMPRAKMDDFARLLSLMLTHPTFPEEELKLFKQRTIAEVLQSKQETGPQAWKLLCRNLFTSSHPMYEETEEEEIEKIKSITREDLFAFHAQFYGTGKTKFVVTGDANNLSWERLASAVFTPMREIVTNVEQADKVAELPVNSSYTTLRDKSSVDVFVGHPIKINVNSKEFFALKLGLHILGGDFVSRLMQEVRVKRGLSYGTNANTSGLNDGDTGLFYTWGTFAPTFLSKGIGTTKEVLNSWVKRGITKAELARAKEAMPGNYMVSLSDSSGVAGAIMNILQTGKELSFLDDYPKIIQSLMLADVNNAIRKHIHPDNLIFSAAGNINAEGNPLPLNS